MPPCCPPPCISDYLYVLHTLPFQTLTGKLLWSTSEFGIFNRLKQSGEIDWPRNYAALHEYYKEFGTCNVHSKRSYECTLKGMGENGEDVHFVGNLGVWLRNQRQAKKGQGPGRLTPERLALLQALVDEGE